MIQIKGIRAIKPVKVDLTKFFDAPHSVTVRALSTPARAKVQELTVAGIRYATSQRKADLKIEAMEQSIPAGTTLEIRKIKLEDAVVDHDLVDDDGKRLAWDADLWDALDSANPAILAKVLDAIQDLSYPEEEGSDPT